MARSLGLVKVPTLDPKGEQDYPSYEYVRALARAIDRNFEIVNSAYGGNRDDTNTMGSVYRFTQSSHNISVGFTVALGSGSSLGPGSWVIQAKGVLVNTNGNVEYTVRLRDNTNSVTLDTIQSYSLDPYRIPYALMGTVVTEDPFTVSVEDTAASSAGTMQNYNIVLWAYQVLEVL